MLPQPVYERGLPGPRQFFPTCPHGVASERHQNTCVGWQFAFLPQVKPENLFITPSTFPQGKIFPEVPFPASLSHQQLSN